MATLSVNQLQALVQLGHWISQHRSRSDQGEIQFQLVDAARMQSAACWNWALNGGAGHPNNLQSPTNIYQHNDPFDVYTERQRTAMSTQSLPVGWQIEAANLPALWLAAKNSPHHRLAFVETMAQVTARANGLTPTDQITPYTLHVTMKGDEWFGWDHWALGIEYGGQTIYLQTEPNRPINFGFTRFWEAGRGGNINAWFYISGIHQAHKVAAKLALMQPPPNASWLKDSTAPNCTKCHARFVSSFLKKSGKHHCRRCGHIFCANCSSHVAVVGHRLTRWGGRKSSTKAARVCDDCYTLSLN